MTAPEAPPSLDALVENPGRARGLSPEAAAALLARCSALQSALTASLLTRPASAGSLQSASDRLLTIPDVAERLAVPASYAYELARQGKLPTVRLGKYVRVRAALLTEWLTGRGQSLDDPAISASVGRPGPAAAPVPGSRGRLGRATRARATPEPLGPPSLKTRSRIRSGAPSGLSLEPDTTGNA